MTEESYFCSVIGQSLQKKRYKYTTNSLKTYKYVNGKKPT